MKEAIKLQWLVALTSGEYKQGTGQLVRHNNTEYDLKYCCLGVLCDLHHKLTGEGYWKDGYYITKSDKAMGNIPREVRLWADIPSNEFMIGNRREDFITMNDGLHYPFEKIADLIDQAL